MSGKKEATSIKNIEKIVHSAKKHAERYCRETVEESKQIGTEMVGEAKEAWRELFPRGCLEGVHRMAKELKKELKSSKED